METQETKARVPPRMGQGLPWPNNLSPVWVQAVGMTHGLPGCDCPARGASCDPSAQECQSLDTIQPWLYPASALEGAAGKFGAPTPPALLLYAAIKKCGEKAQPHHSSFEGFLAERVFTQGLRRAHDTGKPLARESLVTGPESIGTQTLSGFQVSSGTNNRRVSRSVEMPGLTGDGRART